MTTLESTRRRPPARAAISKPHDVALLVPAERGIRPQPFRAHIQSRYRLDRSTGKATDVLALRQIREPHRDRGLVAVVANARERIRQLFLRTTGKLHGTVKRLGWRQQFVGHRSWAHRKDGPIFNMFCILSIQYDEHIPPRAMMSFMRGGRPKVDAVEFADRLNTVLDDIEGVPPLARGRAPWLAKRFKVSQPTARSWLVGDFLPERDRITQMASDFGTTYDHLVFGGSPEGVTTIIESTSRGPQSQSVRDKDLKLAIQLAYEAIGEDKHLPPAQHAELVMLLLEVISDDLPEAQVLTIARRTANAINRGLDHDARREDHPDTRTAGKRR